MRDVALVVNAIELDESGAGVGHAADGGSIAEIAVPDLLPGEAAEVAIEHRSPHRAAAWGRIVARVGPPSPDRVAPACPGFGRCGGCAWQHLAYPAQLAEKRRRVARALAAVPAVLGGTVAIAPVVASPRELGYRNKGKYVVGLAGGRVVLGAYAPRSHRVVDTAGCRVVAPVVDQVAAAARDAIEAAGLAVYDERRAAGEARYVVVRADAAGAALVVLVVTSTTRAGALAAAAGAIARHPAVRGVVAMRNDRTDGAIVSGDTAVLAGQGSLVEEIAGCPVEVGAGEFLQVNREQAAAIYARVADHVAGAARVVELYAGLGGIAFTVARRGAHVHAIDVDAAAVAALRCAAEAGGLGTRVTAAVGDAASVAGPADAIVVDPPRKGLSAATRAALVALAPPQIVYVSCGPESLGRDLDALAAHYRPTAIEPYDLMPGTAQVETVVNLVRSGSP